MGKPCCSASSRSPPRIRAFAGRAVSLRKARTHRNSVLGCSNCIYGCGLVRFDMTNSTVTSLPAARTRGRALLLLAQACQYLPMRCSPAALPPRPLSRYASIVTARQDHCRSGMRDRENGEAIASSSRTMTNPG